MNEDYQMWPPIAETLRMLGAEVPPSRNGWTKLRCFKHEDRKPSAAFSVQFNSYNCMSCGLKGAAINLLMDEWGCDFASARDKARDIFGAGDSLVREESDDSPALPGLSRGERGRRSQVSPGVRRQSVLGA